MCDTAMGWPLCFPVRHLSQDRSSSSTLTPVMLAIMPLVFEGVYGQTPAVISLNYLASSIGVIVMSQIIPYLANLLYKRLTARQPEQKPLP